MKMLFAFLWVKIQNDVMTLLGRCSLKGQAKQKKKTTEPKQKTNIKTRMFVNVQ